MTITLNSALTNGIQSLSALSISSPATIATLVAAGVLATGVAAVVIHEKWENYEEKKHKEEIEAINKLHKRFLERIEVPGYGMVQGFPPIFKFGPEKDSKTVDSLHYTEDEIRDIGTNLPHIAPVLTSYRQSVLNAILKLKEYYLSRDKHNDVTAGVLSYLLNMLQTKCLSFEGYDYDIAYLNAIADFIDAYASKDERINSQHFSRLRPVYSYLLDARQKLEKHKESLSLQELVDELRSTCIDDSNKLIRLLVKMVVPDDDKALAETVTLDELKDNILRREYIKTEKLGIVFKKFPEINLPESVFKDWIKGLAKYYLQSLNPSSILKEKNTLQPNELFIFSNWADSVLKQKMPTKSDKALLDKSLHSIHDTFKKSPNFINTKLSGTEKKPEFIVVKEQNELLNSTAVMADFAHLIHGIISLQAFCAHLLHSIDQLGAIYINDPQHFNEIFTVLDNLCLVIQNDLKKNKRAFTTISQNNKNTMRLADEELFPKEIGVVLESVEQMLLKLGQQVKDYKNKHAEPADKATESAVYEMLTVAQFFEKMYSIAPDRVQPIIYTPPVSVTPTPKAPEESASTPDVPDASEEIEETEELDALQLETELNHLSSQINTQIVAIQKQQQPDIRCAKYQNIYNTLRILQIKSIEMLNERGKDDDRQDKASRTYNLTLSLYQTTLQFLSLPEKERNVQAGTFIQKIHEELNSPENSEFIDRHHNHFSKLIYQRLGFFKTATRNKLSVLEQACKSLQPSTV